MKPGTRWANSSARITLIQYHLKMHDVAENPGPYQLPLLLDVTIDRWLYITVGTLNLVNWGKKIAEFWIHKWNITYIHVVDWDEPCRAVVISPVGQVSTRPLSNIRFCNPYIPTLPSTNAQCTFIPQTEPKPSQVLWVLLLLQSSPNSQYFTPKVQQKQSQKAEGLKSQIYPPPHLQFNHR